MKLIKWTVSVYFFIAGFLLCAEGFVADTWVHNFGNRPSTIKQLCDGSANGKKQFVSGWHEDQETWSSRRIHRAGCGTVNCTITLLFDDNPAHAITCSPIQLFYIPQRSAWVEAYKLRGGNLLCTESGKTVALVGLSLHIGECEVYALRVRKNHTFCVGYYRVLTHNKQFPLLPLAIMARIGVAFGTGAVAGSTAGGFFGPVTCAGGFTIGGIVCALATCATMGHELYHYRMQIGTYEIERKFSSAPDVSIMSVHPCQTIEAPSKGTMLVNVPLPPKDVREHDRCGNMQLPDTVHTGGCRIPNAGCGGKPAELEDQRTGAGCVQGSLMAILAQGNEQAVTPIITVEELLKDCKSGEKTRGVTTQYEREGGFEEAKQDFQKLGVTGVRAIPKGLAGVLPDGRTISVRIDSTAGFPTIQIDNVNDSKNKIRYTG